MTSPTKKAQSSEKGFPKSPLTATVTASFIQCPRCADILVVSSLGIRLRKPGIVPVTAHATTRAAKSSMAQRIRGWNLPRFREHGGFGETEAPSASAHPPHSQRLLGDAARPRRVHVLTHSGRSAKPRVHL